tara:strand:- start:509 stop:1228 length:720 start_codon:yes stop_codon:yes gene_type:complete
MKTLKNISCLIVDDEAIAREIIGTHLSRLSHITVVASCSHAIEAINMLREHSIDLIFLDINMPEISGIALAKSIPSHTKIIFTTAYRDYAVEGFELQAVDYLLKPISFERLLKAVNTYFDIYHTTTNEIIESTEVNPFMFVRSDRKMIKVEFNAIYYIESYSDYIKIHLKNETIVTRETISAVEVKLPVEKFLRIHRSYIVAIQKIDGFTNEYISINNNDLTISRSYKKEVLKLLETYL